MTDFFDHLLLRSSDEEAPASILQPRLPSLFEPAQSADTSGTPTSDPLISETIPPAGQERIPVPSNIELPERTAIAPQEIQPNVSHRTLKPMPPDEPQRTISPYVKHEIVPEAGLTAQAMKEEGSFAMEKREKPLQVSTLSSDAQNTDASTGRKEPVIHPLSVEIRSITEDPPVEEIKPVSMEPVPAKRRPASTIRLQPVSSSSRSAETQPAILQPDPPAARPAGPPQSAVSPEAEQVVEIHIGRIEVRATAPATPVNRTSQKARVMSLEDYLRSRAEDKP